MEQTTQLIQLILNTLLMVLTCVIVLNGLTMRHGAVIDRLHQLQQEHFSLLEHKLNASACKISLGHTKAQIYSFRHRYRLTHASVLGATYALLCGLSSAFALTCRMLMGWNGLIALALVLFIVGIGLLLLSISITLWDVCIAHRSLWSELVWLLQGQQVQEQQTKSMPAKAEILRSRKRSKPSKRMFKKANIMIP